MRIVQRRVLLAALAAAMTTSVALPAAAAADQSGRPGVTSVEVVATGLNTPRGLAWDASQGRVLVAEAGLGGDGPCAPGYGGVIYCYGATGSIFGYWPSTGRAGRVVGGLPSIRNEAATAAVGLHDLTVSGGRVTGLFGLSGSLETRRLLGRGAHPLAQTAVINERTGSVTPVGDLMAFEEANDPDGHIDSNPYGLGGPSPTGSALDSVVADAGGNSLLRVSGNGTVSLIAHMPNRVIDGNEIEWVPTSVVPGPNGSYYVGELTGYPYPVRQARVLRVSPTTRPVVVASGLTNIIDIAVDRQGRLIVLEIAKNGLLSGDNTGRLVRIEHNGSQTELASRGLESPGGVVVAPNGDFYVTNRTDSFGDASGQLLRIRVAG